MLTFFFFLLQTIQVCLVPLCFVLAWGFIFILIWTIWSSVRDVTQRAQKMHQIPCANCQFFTHNYLLKCTVNPKVANTEEAIDCSDYKAQKF